jgi:hypothetical protein
MSEERIVMPLKRLKLVTCKSLAHVLETLVGPDVEVRVLEIALHVKPERLRARLMEEITGIEEEGAHILLGYGLCGRALEGVVSARSTLVLPRVDDCVGALLGSRGRHKELMKQNAGCYFLEHRWLATELNIFEEILKGLDRIPPEKRDRIAKMTLKHYNAVALLDSGDLLPETEALCLTYARQYCLDLTKIKTESGLLTRLIKGPWSEEEFLVLPPGTPVPFF